MILNNVLIAYEKLILPICLSTIILKGFINSSFNFDGFLSFLLGKLDFFVFLMVVILLVRSCFMNTLGQLKISYFFFLIGMF